MLSKSWDGFPFSALPLPFRNLLWSRSAVRLYITVLSFVFFRVSFTLRSIGAYIFVQQAVADEPERRAASRQTCCKQRWMLSMINVRLASLSYSAFTLSCDRTTLITLRIENRQFSATAPAFNPPHLHLAPPLGVTPFEFCWDFRNQKTRVPGLSYGVVCVILRLTVSVEHRLVTEGHTDRHMSTAEIFEIRKLESLGYRMVLFAWSRARPR